MSCGDLSYYWPIKLNTIKKDDNMGDDDGSGYDDDDYSDSNIQ